MSRWLGAAGGGRSSVPARGRLVDAVERAAFAVVAEAVDRGAGYVEAPVTDGGLVVRATDTGPGVDGILPDVVAAIGGQVDQVDLHPGTITAVFPVRVVVAEGQLLTREGIVRVLSDARVTVVAEVSDGDAAVRGVALDRPDATLSTSGSRRLAPTGACGGGPDPGRVPRHDGGSS